MSERASQPRTRSKSPRSALLGVARGEVQGQVQVDEGQEVQSPEVPPEAASATPNAAPPRGGEILFALPEESLAGAVTGVPGGLFAVLGHRGTLFAAHREDPIFAG